jgi:hypothetical protein
MGKNARLFEPVLFSLLTAEDPKAGGRSGDRRSPP